jgi:ABC-type multidrug transport system ATPase subunit
MNRSRPDLLRGLRESGYGAGVLGRGSGTRVFEDFSWEVPSGRTVLLGPNGAGKTTLLGLGASALMPATGSVRIGTVSSTARREGSSSSVS